MCGGTLWRGHSAGVAGGLSPRVRGNPQEVKDTADKLRSIPACAGEPGIWESDKYMLKVYPRVCGGTTPDPPTGWLAMGLSPRVRGNRGAQRGNHCQAGSIPACAGEPFPETLPDVVEEVYPRVCGGTRASSRQVCAVPGLSPRVRGNRRGASC